MVGDQPDGLRPPHPPEAGQGTSLTNARGKTSTTTYDSLGSVLTETDPLNRTTTNTYDLLGRLTGTTDPRGIAVTYGYDARDRLTSTTYPGGTETSVYDALSRRTSLTDATGTTTWTYDAAGRTLTTASPQGTVSYAYDGAGQRTSMTLPGSRPVTYGYDAAGRLTSLTDWQSRVLTLTYDANGRRTGVTRPGGTATAYAYDSADRQTSVTHTGPGGTLATFVSTYDATGNRTSVTSGAGTESYTLDALNRLTSVTYPGGGGTVTYTYDANGNRLTKVAGGVTTTSTYDNADQLLTEGAVTYTFDAAGNVTGNGTATYTWDWAGRLASVTQGGVTTSYTYDGDDVRVRRTQGGTTTNYVWDRESGLPLLVDDGSHAYLHGGGLQGELDATNAPRYHLTDGLGSVRGLTGLAGTSLGTADYDAFGAVRASTGQSSVFGYTGEQTDSETGFSYLRARLYNPASGRFLSRDSVSPNAPGTQGYNPYAYVANNPGTWTDPSGHLATETVPAVSTGTTTTTSRGPTVQQWVVATELFALGSAATLRDFPVLPACLATTWCQRSLVFGLMLTSQPVSKVQWTGVGWVTFTLLGCAMSLMLVDAVGPAGVFVQGGDVCLVTFKQVSRWIKNCTGIPAALCTPTTGTEPMTDTDTATGVGTGTGTATGADDDDRDCEEMVAAWVAAGMPLRADRIGHMIERHGPDTVAPNVGRFRPRRGAGGIANSIRSYIREAGDSPAKEVGPNPNGPDCAIEFDGYSSDIGQTRENGPGTKRIRIIIYRPDLVWNAFPIPDKH